MFLIRHCTTLWGSVQFPFESGDEFTETETEFATVFNKIYRK
jgi:hypothetical protein